MEAVRRIRARIHRPSRFPVGRGEVRRCRGRRRAARCAEPALRRRATGQTRRQAPEREVRRVRFSERLRQGARLSCATGRVESPAAAGAGRAREPRPQSAYRRRGPSLRARRLYRFRARRTVSSRWLSGRRGRRPRVVRQARSGEDARGFPRRLRDAGEGGSQQRPARRDRFLLRRRHDELAGDAVAATGGSGTLLRRRGAAARRAEDQGRDVDRAGCQR